MLGKIELEMMVEEHGLGNIIIESNNDQSKIIKVKHDGVVIENPDWCVMMGSNWMYELEQKKEMFDLDNSEWLFNLNLGTLPSKVKNQNGNHMIRDILTRKFNMWSIIDLDWTGKLANMIGGKKCLEIAAGKGWLSKALVEHGVDCTVTELYPDKPYIKDSDILTSDIEVIKVEELSSEDAIEKYCGSVDVLICSWPPYSPDGDGLLTKAIDQLKSNPDNTITKIVYIGEGNGGCTDSESLWEKVTIDDIINIPKWEWIHDDCYIMSIV